MATETKTKPKLTIKMRKINKLVLKPKIKADMNLERGVFKQIDLDTPSAVLQKHGPAWIQTGRLPDHLSVDDQLFQELLALHPPELGKIKMFGKVIDTPRYQANYGQEYYYTGIPHPANPIPHPYLEDLMAWVSQHSGHEYRQLIINWYMDGRHYIGAHSDSEKGIISNSPIYSITLGPKCTRDFQIISIPTKKVVHQIPLTHEDVLIMGGSMQKCYKHAVPKTNAIVGPRINVTFRLMK